MSAGGTTFEVERLRVGHVDVATVTNPGAPHKWIVTTHGNGEFLEHGFGHKLQLACELGCSVLALDYRDVGRSGGLLLSASEMVADAALCVRHLEARLPAGADPATSILLLGQSMGGAVVTELAARHFPQLPCVNQRSFSSLADVSCAVLGLTGRPLLRRLVGGVLSLAFNTPPWRPPLDSARHWAMLPAGNKLIIYHEADRVIGGAGLYHALARVGRLEGSAVVQLRGKPVDAHNEDPADFSPAEWSDAVKWMQGRLEL